MILILQRTNDESTTEENNSILPERVHGRNSWAPNPLEDALNKSGDSRKTKRRASDIELVVDGLGEFHLDALTNEERRVK